MSINDRILPPGKPSRHEPPLPPDNQRSAIGDEFDSRCNRYPSNLPEFYARWLAQSSLSEHTKRHYKDQVVEFVQFLTDSGYNPGDLDATSPIILARYRDYLLQRHKGKIESVNTKIKSLSSLLLLATLVLRVPE